MTTSSFRLLVAYDGSPAADDMIDDLQNAGIPAGAEALVVSVAERWLPPPSVFELATAPEAARGEVQAAKLALLGAGMIGRRYRDWKVDHEAHTGSPARVIIERARQWGAQLVVVGSLGHNAMERVLIGSVSQKVANEAACSVRISRGQRRSGSLRLLLAYDGLAGSQTAAAAIAARQWPAGTEVHLVAAVESGAPTPLMEPVIEQLQAAGLGVHSTIQEADPKRLIVEEAIRMEAHCIFAGCNDHSVLDRLLLGTVSNALISRASCAVEVVR